MCRKGYLIIRLAADVRNRSCDRIVPDRTGVAEVRLAGLNYNFTYFRQVAEASQGP